MPVCGGICWRFGQGAHLLQDGRSSRQLGRSHGGVLSLPGPQRQSGGCAARMVELRLAHGQGQCSVPCTAAGWLAAGEPGAQASGLCGAGCQDPLAGLVVRAAPDGLWTPSPRRRACWHWARGSRRCLRSPLTLPHVLHEALHEPAGAQGSHRGPGGHRPGWGLPRAVKRPRCDLTGQGRRGRKLPLSASQRRSPRPGESS